MQLMLYLIAEMMTKTKGFKKWSVRRRNKFGEYRIIWRISTAFLSALNLWKQLLKHEESQRRMRNVPPTTAID